MKTILITGGAGFIGSNFVKYFLEKYENEYKVINLDALTYAGNLENLKEIEDKANYVFVKGNIADEEFCRGLFSDYKIEGVINFAAESHVDRSILGSRVFIDTNVIGTHTLLECAKEFKVNRFLQVSTDEVYGSLGKEGLFTEETPASPNSPYSASKASADFIARAYYKTYKLPVLITRCSNNYGPYQFPEKLIPLIIKNCLERKPLPVYGKGENVRDWIYVLDHVKAIEKVFFEGKEGEVYNVGGSNEIQNIDIVKGICKELEKRINCKRGELENLIRFVTDRPGHDMRYAIDSSKIRRTLHWRPETPFQVGLDKTISWYLENNEWVTRITSGDYQSYYDLQYVKRNPGL